MGFLKKQWQGITNEIQNMANHDQIIKYDVMMGILSSSLLCVLESLSYLFFPGEIVRFPQIHLIFSLLMAVQFVGFVIIYRNGYQTKGWASRFILDIHPYLIVLAGLIVTALKSNVAQNTESFLIALFTVILVQIYPLRKRLALFVSAFLGFNGVVFAFGGVSAHAYEALRMSLLLCVVGFVYSSVHYQSQNSRIGFLAQLKEENRIKTEMNDQLTKMNLELDSSHRITDALLRITTQILSTDQLDETLQLLLDEAIRLIPSANAGSVLVLSGDRMQYRAVRGYDLDKMKKITLGVGDIFQSTQKDLYEPMIIRDLVAFNVDHLDETTFQKFQTSDALTAKAILTCAFKYENQFFGLINLDNYESKDAFNEDDRMKIRHLAKQLEITIGIHHLYEKAIRPTKYDELTGAFTRRYHQELLAKALAKAEKTGTRVAVGTVDINFFKEINDHYGHEIGDDCLSFFSQSFRECLSEDAIFSRIGGDEFALVYPNCGREEAQRKVDSIRKYLEGHPFSIKGTDVIVSFACGFAIYPEDGNEFDVLFKVSDGRMYENKVQMKADTGKKTRS